MRNIILITIFTLLLLPMPGAWAAEEAQTAEGLVEHLIEACEPEIENYCSQVTLGEGRMLACFYAHQDKLSGRCEYALYDAAAQLEDFATAIVYLAKACREDLLKFCSQVAVGEGRVGMCLLDNKSEVSESCSKAIDDVGLAVVKE